MRESPKFRMKSGEKCMEMSRPIEAFIKFGHEVAHMDSIKEDLDSKYRREYNVQLEKIENL
jgi:hypothetical protein